jgi:V8-like Glu-specific endopeptidase
METASLTKRPFTPEVGKKVIIVGYLSEKLCFSVGTILDIKSPGEFSTTTEIHYDASTEKGLSGSPIIDPVNLTVIGWHTGCEKKGSKNRGRLFNQDMLDFFRSPPFKPAALKSGN